MTRRGWVWTALPLLLAAALWGTHALAIRVMAEEQVAARLFAAGSVAEPRDLVLAVVFLLLRLVVFLLGPGLVLYGVSRLISRGVMVRRARS